MSKLLSYIRTRLSTQSLSANIVVCSIVHDLKRGIRPHKQSTRTHQIGQEALQQTEMIFQDVGKNSTQSYIKYKVSYDRKANAFKLKERDYVYELQPKADHQGNKIPFTDFCWNRLYVLRHALLHNNYLARKIGTDKAQVLHRLIPCHYNRLRIENPQPTYKPGHKNRNLTLKIFKNMVNCNPEPRSLIFESSFLTAIKMNRSPVTHAD